MSSLISCSHIPKCKGYSPPHQPMAQTAILIITDLRNAVQRLQRQLGIQGSSYWAADRLSDIPFYFAYPVFPDGVIIDANFRKIIEYKYIKGCVAQQLQE